MGSAAVRAVVVRSRRWRGQTGALAVGLGAALAAVTICCGDDRDAPPRAGARRPVDPEVARGGSGVAGPTAPAPAAAAPVAAPDPADAPSPILAGARPAPPGSTGPVEVEALAAGQDDRAAIEDARALTAWSAVLERGRLLERRGERGAAWGHIGAGPGETAWLLDEADGTAGLGIRIGGAGGRSIYARAGARVLTWGAWGLDGERRWVWRVDRMVALGDRAAAAPAGAPAPTQPAEPEAGNAAPDEAAGGAAAAPPGSLSPLPSGRMTELSAPPADALPPSLRVKSGPLLFLVLAAPAKPGDGWSVADGPKQPPAALLVLPGEAPVYGGLDYLSADERWPLELGRWYAVPVVAPAKAPRARELPVLRAQGAPAAVPAPPAPPTRKR